MKFIAIFLSLGLLTLTGAALAEDPFEDARHAIGIRDNATALSVVDSGQVDINAQTSEGYTLLHYAADQNNLAMVEALLARGADPTIKTGSGFTPLSMSASTMITARLQAAIDTRVDGAKPPTVVVGTGDFDKIRYATGIKDNAAAIAELDKGIDINMRTSEGYTLLHYAADQNNLVMVAELLRRGADPNIKSNSGSTPADMGYYYKPVLAAIQAAGGKLAREANARGPVPMPPPGSTASGAASGTPQSPRARMCASRHLSSSALCSDSTCKMREYRKWQTCLNTGSYY